MPARRFAILDVFTTEPLSGNPLAVVFDCDGLDADVMQRIAAEFNLSETVFITKPTQPLADHKLRIFTPKYEMAFAGHPTVGAAIALADGNPRQYVLELNSGLTPAAVAVTDGVAYAEIVAPSLPVEHKLAIHPDRAAKVINIEPFEVGFKRYGVAAFGVAEPYLYIPADGLEVIAKARPTGDLMRGGFPYRGLYAFTRRSVTREASFHARFFAPDMGIAEDPATGSAAVGLAAAIMKFDAPPQDGRHAYIIEQGFEMGRPSMLRLELEVINSMLQRVRLGGNAVKVGEGTLNL
ncbi:MAG: PhzF family phenazine biosynthesis protein [Rhizobiaceae bacterium]|jgi:trans-2,3-dihydro-3-hydroxyanthranilate isomerase|nr:PhzF family phenazine biosynthesis protein [Rhizobiaceae bacterium]